VSNDSQKQTISLKLRLLLAGGLVLIFALGLVGYALDRAYTRSTIAAVEDRLESYFYLALAALEVSEDGALQISDGLVDPRLNQPGSGLYLRIQSEQADLKSSSTLGVTLPEREPLEVGESRFSRPMGEEDLYIREQGIAWMAEAKEAAGIGMITEVMEERFIPLVAETADILQIGSRNMQNYPFLTACAKTGKPIMLKRHFGCSLRDWLGAAEYILLEGNEKVILCERGISAPHTHRSTSRFLLDLQVVPAAQEFTHLPVVVDPSHATFWRPWVKPMALAAIAAGADGIMVEVHPDPPNAAVDPLQPIDFAEFAELVTAMQRVATAVDRRVV
jgi:3-deoxy-7-phosphoheptulonate synthase